MVKWQYLEAIAIAGPDGQIIFKIIKKYADDYKYEPDILYSFTQLGNMGWNLVVAITNIGATRDVSQFIFKRPIA